MHLFVFKRDLMLKGNPTDKHHESDRLERKKKKKKKGRKEGRKEGRKKENSNRNYGAYQVFTIFLYFDGRKSTKHDVSAAKSAPCSRLAN